jgi:hypothetical protein
VQPLVMANCAQCHGADPESPQISGFRLDRYVKNDPNTFDAYDYREAMVRSAARLEAPRMPPTSTLSEQQRNILERWLDRGAPKGERQNRPPRVEWLAPSASSVTVDQSLTIKLRSWDDDGDGLLVLVGLREPGLQEPAARVITGAGIREVTFDTGQLPSGGTFEVFARLDDGFSDDPAANVVEEVLGTVVRVDHGSQGTAPSAQVLRPNGGETLIGSAEVAWTASDPDPGDTVLIDIQLIEVASDGSEILVETIAAGLPNQPASYAWDLSNVPPERNGQPIWYRLRVVARDPAGNVRSDNSDALFTVAPALASTTYTWTDVKALFASPKFLCVGCHGQPALNPTIESFRLDKYDALDPVAPANGDLGVYDVRGRVYYQVVVLKAMPQGMQMNPADIAIVAEWIRAGAPKGSGQ